METGLRENIEVIYRFRQGEDDHPVGLTSVDAVWKDREIIIHDRELTIGETEKLPFESSRRDQETCAVI